MTSKMNIQLKAQKTGNQVDSLGELFMSRTSCFAHSFAERFILPIAIIFLIVAQPLRGFSFNVPNSPSRTQVNLATDESPRRSSFSRSDLRSDLETEWLLKLSHKSSKDIYNQKNLTTVTTGLQISYWPIENYAFIFTPIFQFRNGYQQTLAQTKSSDSKMGLRETSFNYQPFLNRKNSWMLSFGVLPIDFDSNELILKDQSFPGARVAARWGQLFSSISHTVPTSQSLSTETNEFEQTPGFTQTNFGFNFESPSFEATSRLGYYHFSALPQSVATQSGPKGNSVRNLAGREYEFIHPYHGPFVSLAAEQFLNKNNSTGIDGAGVQNTAATAGENTAWTAKAFYRYRWPTKTNVQIFYQHFYLESDSAVAQFNEDFVGGTNRNGFLTGIVMNIRDRFSLQVSGGTSDAIIESPTIFRENFFRIKLETQYAGI